MSSKHDFSSADEVLKTADTCLYIAKSSGRNRVVTCNSCQSKPQTLSIRPFAVAT